MTTTVSLSNIELRNPVIPASGTFGFGEEFAALYDLNCLGGISFKGTTREARYGNALPRIAECGGYGMLNAVGLQNPGVEHVVAHELPRLRELYKGVVLANVSGFSIDDYVYTCEQMDKAPEVDIIEVNISCPNVKEGGIAFGQDPKAVEAITKEVKKLGYNAAKELYRRVQESIAGKGKGTLS